MRNIREEIAVVEAWLDAEEALSAEEYAEFFEELLYLEAIAELGVEVEDFE